jgi:predicted phage terminase large subunit-like protein
MAGIPGPKKIAERAKLAAYMANRQDVAHAKLQQAQTDEGRRALKRQLAIVTARTDFMAYVRFTSPDPEDMDDVTRSRYKDAPHHRAIARALEKVASGEIQQLILTMPPRHGKSELTTRKFPAWLAGRFPDQSTIVGTYNDDFAADFGAEVLNLIKSPSHRQVFPKSGLRRGGTAKDRIQMNEGGLLGFVGRGGSLTGRGAHTLILDDLIKDDKEASSQAIRDQAWNWFTKVAMTRRMGLKRVIMIMTRWHADDPIGRLTDPENPSYNATEASKWKIINLPAIAEKEDPLGREVGEALWPDGPDRFDLDFLESQQRLDPLGFSALYQQRPTAVDGVLFQRDDIRFYTPEQLPDKLRMYAASDHAVSILARRDYTVLLAGGVDKHGALYFTDCIWQRITSDKQVEFMLEMARTKNVQLWFAEKGQITKSLGPFLRKRMGETNTYFNVVEMNPAGDKEQRAQSIAARIAMGSVYFPRNAPWTERAIAEMLSFPNGVHDDFVDALSLFGLGLRSQFSARSPAKEESTIPKFGTLAWTKWLSTYQKEQRTETGGF